MHSALVDQIHVDDCDLLKRKDGRKVTHFNEMLKNNSICQLSEGQTGDIKSLFDTFDGSHLLIRINEEILTCESIFDNLIVTILA